MVAVMGRPKKIDLTGITERPEGGYHCYVDLGRRPDGRRHVKHLTGRTQELVAKKRQELLDRVRQGLRTDSDAKLTLDLYLTRWLQEKEAGERREYADNTLKDYRDAVEKLTRVLGHVRMDTPAREFTKLIEAAAGKLLREGRTRRPVARVSTAAAVRAWALNQGLQVAATGKLPASVRAAWETAGSPAPVLENLSARPYETLSDEQQRQVRLSRVYVRNIFGKLSMVCNEAVRDGLMRVNPVHGARLPEPKPERKKVVFDPEQVARVTAELTGRDLIRWSLAVGLGLRQGEVLGLRWSRIDLDRGVAVIDTQAQWRPWRHGCQTPAQCGAAAKCPRRHAGGMYLKSRTKEEDDGQVPLSPQLVTILRAHRAAQGRDRLLAGSVWTDLDLVFCTPTGGIVDRSNDNKHWHRILREHGLPAAGTHSAKHTAITLAFDSGVDDLLVSRFVGRHASGPAFTRKQYQHILDGRAREMAAQLGQAVFGGA